MSAVPCRIVRARSPSNGYPSSNCRIQGSAFARERRGNAEPLVMSFFAKSLGQEEEPIALMGVSYGKAGLEDASTAPGPWNEGLTEDDGGHRGSAPKEASCIEYFGPLSQTAGIERSENRRFLSVAIQPLIKPLSAIQQLPLGRTVVGSVHYAPERGDCASSSVGAGESRLCSCGHP